MTRSRLRRVILTAALTLPLSLLAMGPAHGETPRYFVFDLPTLGGTTAEGRNVNELGLVSGISDLEGGETRHAALWLGGFKLDLGTLGGPNSAVLFNVNNDFGTLVGFAETDELDPENEGFSCSAFFPGGYPGRTGHQCRGFVWHLGRKRALDTLGGEHGFAASANNRGRAVGWAQTEVDDSSCVAPAIHQFLGVVWNARTGKVVKQFDPLPGDSVTTANAINDRGQVIGISGDCGVAVGGVSARHAVLWDVDGTPTVLGDFGEDTWNTPLDINQRGDIVGFLGVDGGDNLAAFSWTEEDGLEPLDPLAGDAHSEAWGINESRQAAGLSCGDNGCTALLWEQGVVHNLNDLVQDSYDGHLRTARDINDRGWITGQSEDPDTGERRAYLAIRIR